MKHLGDFDASTVIYDKFTTYRPSTGAPYTLGGTPALSVYKDNSTTQSTTGVTLTVDFDSVTGMHHYAIDTSADGTFYSAGSFFQVVITTGTVDGVSAAGTVVGAFTIRKNSALKPATAGRTLVVDAAGLADANAVKLGPSGSGTAQTAGDLAATLATIAAYVDTEVAAIKAKTDNLPSDPADASDIAASFSSIASTLTTIAAYIDTEVAAIKAKTDNLPIDPADASDIAASFSTVNSTLATIAAYVDTEVAAIKAKTDNLPTDPADASDIAASFSTVNSTLATIAAYVDTEVAAIKAKTDNLPADPADASDIAASFSSLASSIATLATYVDTEVAAIKAKTDNLPADPADASDVAAAFSTLGSSVAALATDVDDLKSGIILGAAATGTLSTTQATSNLTGYADDQLIGRVIIWLTGNCEGEATDITDYSSASGLLTFTALTTAPGNGDTFKIV